MKDILTPAQFVAKMITGFSLPAVIDDVRGKSPVTGRELERAERALLNMSTEGRAFVFEGDDGDILMDLSENRSQIWFHSVVAHTAQPEVESAVLLAYPQLKLFIDETLASDKTLRRRAFEGPMSDTRVAQFEITFPAKRTKEPGFFMARVYALAKEAAQAPRVRSSKTAPTTPPAAASPFPFAAPREMNRLRFNEAPPAPPKDKKG